MFKSLLKGTFILTITGLITRIIGFIYKIYLSNILGAKMLGIYQLVFPVFSICFTIFGAGIQTAISQMIATKKDDISFQKKVLIRSLALSTALSFLLFFVVYISADSIAYNLLGESDCADALRILVWAFPVCGIAACINGCYYGMQKATVPAMTQLIEQIARVVFVYTVAIIFSGNNVKMMCLIAVAGIGVGEGISMIYSMIMIIR